MVAVALVLSLCMSTEFDFTDALQEPILAEGQTFTECRAFIQRRIPALNPPDTAADWDREAAALRTRMLDEVVFRGVPASWRSTETPVVWGDVHESGPGYRIRTLRFEAVPGLWVPAALYEPVDIGEKLPGVLNVNGHLGEPGKSREDEQIRSINLAKRGIISLHPEWLNMGQLLGPGYGHNDMANLDICGVSGLAVFYRAMQGGLDVLLEHPEIDPGRIAMTGLSGGGWQTILLSALDTRITVSVPNAGYVGIGVRVDHHQDIGDLEQIPSDMLTVGDYTHLTALLAPRPSLLLYNERDECCFTAYRVRPSVYGPILPYYDLYEATGRFAYYVNADPGTHNYERDNREQFYAFLNTHFGLNTPNEEIPVEGELLDPKTLYVDLPADNATFESLARPIADALPERPAPALDAPDFAAWQYAGHHRLRHVLRLPDVDVTAVEVGAEERDGLHIVRYRLAMGEWTVPVVALKFGTSAAKGTVIALADEGRAAAVEAIAEALVAGQRVIAIDPVYLGEAALHPERNWQVGMIVETVGERILGQQTAQLLAAARWARDTWPDAPVAFSAVGRNAGVAALAAAALCEGGAASVTLREGLTSLKDLVAAPAPYSRVPALYAFGLLREFDIADLKALCAPAAIIELVEPPTTSTAKATR